LIELLDHALDVAQAAGVEILKIYASCNMDVVHKVDGSPLTKADLRAASVISTTGNPPREPRGLEVEFFPKEEVLHEKVKIYR
jgi:hypothetical protein